MEKNGEIILVCSKISEGEQLTELIMEGSSIECESKREAKTIMYTFTITTKYYTAAMNLSLIQMTYEGDVEAQLSSQLEGEVEEIEGVIYMLNPESQLQMAKIHDILDKYSKINTLIDPDVSVLFVNCSQIATLSQNIQEDIKNIAMESMIEIINEDMSKWLKGRYEVVEKEGIARIVEALECNTWSNMVYKPQPKFPKDKEPLTVAPASTINPYIANLSEQSIEEVKMGEEAREEGEIMKDGKYFGGNIESLLKGVMNEGTQMDDFAKLMLEIQNNKQMGKELSDSQRRTNAENLINRFTQLIDVDVDADDVDDGELEKNENNEQNLEKEEKESKREYE